MQIRSIAPSTELAPRTAVDPGYYDAPPGLLSFKQPSEGRLSDLLRQTAQLRDGNAILKRVADAIYANSVESPQPYSQDEITAMTQLAVTGSAAFAAWSQNPTKDLSSYLTGRGMSSATAQAASQQIMSDFNAALNAVRNPLAGATGVALRTGAGMKYNWIAVSGEDDRPDYPVNVAIAPYPQFHLQITVNGIPLTIRYIIASSNDSGIQQDGSPHIPPGNEVIIYIHGEGSRAEEACDFIPALFAAVPAGRSITVIAFDQPSCGYSTMVPHLHVAPPPPISNGPIDTSSFAGSPILDFVEATIATFIETLIRPLGNRISAVVGGSLGGHMALRFAARNDQVKRIAAWSPASVMEHAFSLLGVSISQRLVSDRVLADRAMDPPSGPASLELEGQRLDFFTIVWDKDTANVAKDHAGEVAALAAALLASGLFSNVGGVVTVGVLTIALLALTPVPAQPLMWYRDDWPTGATLVQLAPWGQNAMVGPAKATYIQESRRDRREVYNADYRRWHWRICEEMLGYEFDALAPSMQKPLLLMVGEKDDYPDVHFLSHVRDFAGTLSCAGYALTVQDTGHSIHNERPAFLAQQILWLTQPIALSLRNSMRIMVGPEIVTFHQFSLFAQAKGQKWPPTKAQPISALSLIPVPIPNPFP